MIAENVIPHPSARPVRLSCADTAKIMRAELKAAFPGVKFSVRSSLFSMGSSIDVKWTDGPTQKAVDVIVNGFAACSFDGRDDSTHYNGPMVIGGRRMDSGAKYVGTERRYSLAFFSAVAAHVASTYGDAVPEIKLESDGAAYIPNNLRNYSDGNDATIADRIYEAIQDSAEVSL